MKSEPTRAIPIETGVLLVNLGTPDSPTPWAVMKFLGEFLSDGRVVELPKLLWRFILYGIILPFRSFKVAKKYQAIWTSHGSPQRVIMAQLAERLSIYLSAQIGLNVPVISAMTYGNPSLKQGISTLRAKGVSRLIVLPLFPYYSSTTTAAVLDAVARQMAKLRSVPSIFFIHEYGLRESYLDALAESIRAHWHVKGRAERLLFSFHGLPKRNQQKGDPYPEQCIEAAKRLVKILNIADNYWKIGFQSRFGYNEWLTPATDDCLTQWALEGVKSVEVVSPSFAVECLETVEELDDQSRHLFLKAGGESFQYIPTMNDTDRHVRVLGNLINKFF